MRKEFGSWAVMTGRDLNEHPLAEDIPEDANCVLMSSIHDGTAICFNLTERRVEFFTANGDIEPGEKSSSERVLDLLAVLQVRAEDEADFIVTLRQASLLIRLWRDFSSRLSQELQRYSKV